MENGFVFRLKNAWNAFLSREPTDIYKDYGENYYYRPDRIKITASSKRTVAVSIFTRFAIDISSIEIRHVQTDDEGNYISEIKSDLNRCFSLEANIDQTPTDFMRDVIMSMFDEGCIAIVPVDINYNDNDLSEFDVETMRTGKILSWYPEHIKVSVYNERKGRKEEIIVPKNRTAIIENPFYSIVNESNSTTQRLIRKLALLDIADERNNSGKLDLLIQLPYTIKSELRKRQARERKDELVEQLVNSNYGIAYTDGSEKVTQLNRAVENNLQTQVEYLTSMLYSQFGISKSVLDGTADEKTMLNYRTTIVEYILKIVIDEMKRKFLSEKAIKNNQTIMYFVDPFKGVPVSQLAESSDKFTRNEIMSSNEVRQKLGMKPSDDPEADVLRNKNLNKSANNDSPTITDTKNAN